MAAGSKYLTAYPHNFVIRGELYCLPYSIDNMMVSEALKMPLPADGFASLRDWQNGHRPRPGGMDDQPNIWIETVRATGHIEAKLTEYVHKKQAEEQKQKGKQR